MQRVIITGAASFIGLAAVRELLRQGAEVYAVVRNGTGGEAKLPRHENCHIVESELSAYALLPDKIEQADAFIHLAWGGTGGSGRSAADIQEQNIFWSLDAVRAAARMGCARFLFAGSQAEYGIHHEIMNETAECRPVSEYGKAKLAFGRQAEALCRELGMEYIHARIFSVYGPGDHPWTLVNSCLAHFQADEQMELGLCTHQWNFIYIDDMARALAALLRTPWLQAVDGCVYNVAGEDTRALKSFVEEIHRLCGEKGSCLYGVQPYKAEGPVNLWPDIGKLMAVTGWKPQISFEEGIHRTMAEGKSSA